MVENMIQLSLIGSPSKPRVFRFRITEMRRYSTKMDYLRLAFQSSVMILILQLFIFSCPIARLVGAMSGNNTINSQQMKPNLKSLQVNNNNNNNNLTETFPVNPAELATEPTFRANEATPTTPPYVIIGRKITDILNEFFQKGYDRRVRPNYGGPPVLVNVTMHIISISSVSEVQMDFTADFYFRQTWQDPRLRFKGTNEIKTLFVGAEVSKRIWFPDTFFGNEKVAQFHDATTPNIFLRIEYTGEVYRSIRLTVTSSCPMKLQYFPMDRQSCTIEIESYGYDVKDIIYSWAGDSAVGKDPKISLPQFDITNILQRVRHEELSSGTYLRLVAEIHFARRMGYYLIQIYIPSSLIVVISWVSFWLHRNASPARVQLGVTTVLTMTTLMSSTNAALPKISYVKSIDVFLGTCFVMVFAALLEYATVGYLGKRIAMRKAHAQNVLSHAVAMTQRMIAAQNQANLVTSMSNTGAAPNAAPNGTNQHQHQQQSTQAHPNHQQQHQFLTHDNHNAHNHNNNNNMMNAPNNGQTTHNNQVFIPIMSQNNNNPMNNSNNNTNTNTNNANKQNNQVPNFNQLQQANIVEQFLNTAATLPNLVNADLDGKQPKVAKTANPFSVATGSRGIESKLAKGKQIDSIFGVRPSSIDKYSRVVFPVCFVCFQLMYWIVYLHISAFLESESLQQ